MRTMNEQNDEPDPDREHDADPVHRQEVEDREAADFADVPNGDCDCRCLHGCDTCNPDFPHNKR
jgi:hypothetical protein